MEHSAQARTTPRRRRAARALSVVVVGGLSIGFATNAAFTDTEGTQANTFTAGTLDLTASPASQAWTVTNMAPGDEEFRTVSVGNAGTLPLAYDTTALLTAAASGRVAATAGDPPGRVGAPGEATTLADALVMAYHGVVTDDGSCAPGAATASVFDALSATTATAVGTTRSLAPGASELLCYSATLPIETTNERQGDSATFDLTYTARQVDAVSATVPEQGEDVAAPFPTGVASLTSTTTPEGLTALSWEPSGDPSVGYRVTATPPDGGPAVTQSVPRSSWTSTGPLSVNTRLSVAPYVGAVPAGPERVVPGHEGVAGTRPATGGGGLGDGPPGGLDDGPPGGIEDGPPGSGGGPTGADGDPASAHPVNSVTVTNPVDGRLDLAWAPVTGATSYRVRAVTGYGEDASAPAAAGWTTDTHFVGTGLDPATPVTYEVSAVVAAKGYAYTRADLAYPSSNRSQLRFTAIDNGQTGRDYRVTRVFEWDAVPGATGYQLTGSYFFGNPRSVPAGTTKVMEADGFASEVELSTSLTVQRPGEVGGSLSFVEHY